MDPSICLSIHLACMHACTYTHTDTLTQIIMMNSIMETQEKEDLVSVLVQLLDFFSDEVKQVRLECRLVFKT